MLHGGIPMIRISRVLAAGVDGSLPVGTRRLGLTRRR